MRKPLRKKVRRKDSINSTSKRRSYQFQQLEPRMMLTGIPIITEFMASNDGTLLDGNGNSSDWIEIYNAGTSVVDLDDYGLTDNPSNTSKWQFPSRPLEPGEYLVVFASGDDTPDVAGNLHTNFKLSASGEYLGLYSPNGTVLSEFNTGGTDYPPQITDVTYGRPFTETSEVAIPVGSTIDYVIPDAITGPALDTAWTQPGYVLGSNGEAWQSGAAGIGYDLDNDFDSLIATDVQSQLFGQGTSAYVRSTFNRTPGETIDRLILRAQYDDGFVAYLNGVEVLKANGPLGSDVQDGTIPLSNLLDDDKNTSLVDAIASDTYQAVASSSDLGIFASVAGGLDADLAISPTVTFNLSSIGGGSGQAGSPSNDTFRSLSTDAIRTTGVSSPLPSIKIEDGIGMTANNLLTFDLDELRVAGGYAATDGFFTARAGLNDTAGDNRGLVRTAAILSDASGNVIAGYVNGQQVDVSQSGGVWSFTGSIPPSLQGVGAPRLSQFAFSVPANATHLTLATTSVGSINTDHAVFSGANLEFNSVPLGNLFDDSASTLLSDAITTNTFGARGDIGDLGVEIVQDGEFQAPQTIAPSILFDLANVGSTQVGDGIGPGNDTVNDQVEEPIRTRGVTFSSLNERLVEEGIGLPADELITFNLDEIRDAGGLGNDRGFRFKTRAAINDWQASGGSGLAIAVVSDDAGNVLGAWVNGELTPVINTGGIWSLDFSGGMPSELTSTSGGVDFDLLLDDSASYLTLISGGVSTSTADRIAFSGARLVVLPGDEPITWESASAISRDDTDAVNFREFDLSGFTNLIQDGANTLAIHVLNTASNDRDLLFSHEVLTSQVVFDNNSGRYFTNVTAGLPNDSAAADIAPIITSVTDSPNVTDNDDIIIQAALFETVAPVTNVNLFFRVMYDAEFSTPMLDDGSIAGDIAGDGIYTALIPASVSNPGEMVRWRVTAEDTLGRMTKAPSFDDPFKSPEYFGTMIEDTSFSTPLEVIHWFQGTAGRGSVYHDGEFYDNVLIRTRGQSSNNSPKKNLKFDFNPDKRFLLDPTLARVDEINLNNTYYDQADVRATLSSEVFAAAGTPTPITYPVHTRRNGEFYSLAILVEQVDAEFLEHNGLDPDGALYKSTGLNGFDPNVGLAGFEKKTRLDEGDEALSELAQAVNPALPQAERETYLYDNVDVFSVINYLAATSIIHNVDHTSKNHYMFQDTNGTGEWSFLPWDLDLTFGKNGANTPNIESYEAAVTDKSLNTFPNSHPFFGGSEYTRFNNPNVWNRLIDAVFDTPELREIYLRRLRSVMDTILQSPDTAPEDLIIEGRLAELLPLIQADWTLDDARWVEAPQTDLNRGTDWGEDLPLATHFQRIIDRFLEPRRTHLYETHNIANLPSDILTTLVEERATGNYFVPTNNSLGTTWTTAAFDDSGWTNATLGIGYETSGSNFAPLIETSVRPQDTPGGATSVFTRIPFNVDQLEANAQLTLQARYDDGFVAYINGTEVARRNVTGTPTYNGSASNNPDGNAVIFEPIDISQHTNLLNLGSNNVLAIHSMNAGVGSSDQLIMVELTYGQDDPFDVAGIPDEQVPNLPIQIDPVDFDANPASGNQNEEYLKLNNPNNTAVDISGWRLRGGVDRVMRPGTVIPAGGSLYVVADAKAFRARTTGPSGSQNLLVHGNYEGNLSSSSETIELVSNDDTVIDTLITPDANTPNQRFLRLTEVHYNPAGSGDPTEFLEFTNISSGGVATTLDLSGVTIEEGPSEPFVFPNGTMLAAGERILVVKNQAAMLATYPGLSASDIAGEFIGGLSNIGEDITVRDDDGSLLVEMDYLDHDLWSAIADGAGGSLELIDPTSTPFAQLGKPQSWRPSTNVGGTPAAANSQPLGVVINEVLTHTDTPLKDAIELYNPTSSPIDVGGWYLSDSDDALQKYQIPLGTIIAARGYLVFDESDFNPTPNTPGANDFALNSTDGDQVWLTTSSGLFADQVEFGPTLNAESLGRLPNGTGRLAPQSRITLGAENRTHRNGPLVITELQYNPSSPSTAALAVDPQLTSDDLEFIEIHNATLSTISLDNWALAGEVPIAFDPGTLLAAGATLVVVSFNPTNIDNALRLDAFRTHYGIDNTVTIVGGYSGQLSNGYGRVELTQPDAAPELPTGFTPTTSDEVVYDDFAPWATAADGLGSSLQRVTPTSFGNASTSWAGATPTPGTVNFGSVTPGDFNGDGLVSPADLALLIDASDADSVLAAYNLNGLGGVDQADVDFLIDVIVNPIPGDYDWDDDVDDIDFRKWRGAFGSPFALEADGNRDGTVDAADYTVWRSNLGTELSATEPAVEESIFEDSAAQTERAVVPIAEASPIAPSVATTTVEAVTPTTVPFGALATTGSFLVREPSYEQAQSSDTVAAAKDAETLLLALNSVLVDGDTDDETTDLLAREAPSESEASLDTALSDMEPIDFRLD